MERMPILTTEQRQARLIYARENLNRSWNSVMFSGEKTFYASPTSGRMCAGYKDILEDILIPSVKICYGDMTNVIFMQVSILRSFF